MKKQLILIKLIKLIILIKSLEKYSMKKFLMIKFLVEEFLVEEFLMEGFLRDELFLFKKKEELNKLLIY